MKRKYEHIHNSCKSLSKEAIEEAHKLFPDAALVDVERIKYRELG